MSRRVTLTYICDNCGLEERHEVFGMAYDVAIATLDPHKNTTWVIEKVIGTNIPRDYCKGCAVLKGIK